MSATRGSACFLPWFKERGRCPGEVLSCYFGPFGLRSYSDFLFQPWANPYPNAKLATILFTMELARRLEGSGVTVNALHPGFTATGFGKNNGKVMAALVSIVAPLVARSPAKGAETSIYLASSPSVEGMTGKYFYNSHVTRAAPQATDMAVARKLWEVSAELVHLPDGLPLQT